MPEYFNYVLIFLTLIFLTFGYFKLAKWLDITDDPVGRSSHTITTYTGLGVLFPVAILISIMFVKSTPPIGPFFVIALLLLSIISFIDDIVFVKHSIRFVFQIFALVLMVIEMPLGFNVWTTLPIYTAAIVFGIGVVNAYNFMDGINGMFGLNTLFTLIYFLILNDFIPSDGAPLHFIDSRILFSLIAASLIFCFFNCRKKAVSFAGDVGAISMGFIILYILFLLLLKTQNFAYLMLLLVFGLDAGITVFYKIILRENIFVPHRDFLFKKLAHVAKIPHLKISAIYTSVQGVLSITTILFLRDIPKVTQIAVLFVSIVLLTIVYIHYRNKLTKKKHEPAITDGRTGLKTTFKRTS